MNIFEFLGYPSDHRTGNKIVQLVKHLDEVPDSRKHCGTYGVQLKHDGVFSAMACYKGTVMFFGRTGKLLKNLDLLINNASTLKDGIYFGEIVSSNMSLEQLSGCIQPNRVAPLSDKEVDLFTENLSFMMFDFVSIKDFIEGESDKPYTYRYEELSDIFDDCILGTLANRYNKCPTYFTNIDEAITIIHLWIEDGAEGGVIKHLDAGWKAGHKGWHQMKIVRGIDYDLECIGYEEGSGKYSGKVANLIFKWKNGKEVKCMLGKGWTHDDAENMFNSISDPSSVLHPIGKIFQVYALQESSKGVLRLPKVGELRHDKNESDF